MLEHINHMYNVEAFHQTKPFCRLELSVSIFLHTLITVNAEEIDDIKA